MRLAHLILAHKNPLQLERLIKALSDANVDIYIQLDGKVSVEAFEHLKKISQVFFIKNRTQIHWGNYSIIQATLNGFEEILATGNTYSHINLLSGQDYPLQSNSSLLHFLFNNIDKTFMHSLSIDDEWQEAQPRIRKYHFGDFMFRGRYRLQAIVNFFMPARKMPANLKPYGRSQWLTITPVCASYLIKYLKEHPEVKKFFRMTWAPDEFIFQTILYNSSFRETMINDNLRYINFIPGEFHPTTITIADKDALLQSGKFFARKFTGESDTEILNYLDRVRQNNQ